MSVIFQDRPTVMVVALGDGRVIVRGLAGQSAYDLAVAHGFEGSEADWLESIGAQGGVINKTAAQALGGHRVVKIVSADGVDYADINAPADADLVIGVTTGAASAADPVPVQAYGELQEPSWSWSLGAVFVGPNGTLTQTPPSGAWLRQVGTAVAPDKLLINLRPAILTA